MMKAKNINSIVRIYLKKIIKRTGVKKAIRNPIMILSGEKCCRINGNSIEKQNISNKRYNFWMVNIDLTSIMHETNK